MVQGEAVVGPRGAPLVDLVAGEGGFAHEASHEASLIDRLVNHLLRPPLLLRRRRSLFLLGGRRCGLQVRTGFDLVDAHNPALESMLVSRRQGISVIVL